MSEKLAKTITELSRSDRVSIDYTEGEGNTNLYADLYEAVGAGCLQRIALSLESIDQNLQTIAHKLPDRSGFPTKGEAILKKQVSKLAARLKAAGLDGDPYSDRRSRKQKGHAND